MENIQTLRVQLAEQALLNIGWDSYGAAVPNVISMHNCKLVLDRMEALKLEASRVTPSVDGGVAVIWKGEFNKERLAYIECENDGTVCAVTSDWAAASPDKNNLDHIRVWHIGDLHTDLELCGEPDPGPGSLVLTLEETLEHLRYFIWVDYGV